ESKRPLSGLLLTYPVHQAADILFCDADLVPVGKDQLPHLEVSRLIARRFNDRYGPTFTEPEALLSPAPLVLGTDGRKMSKSAGNTIPLGASEDATAQAFGDGGAVMLKRLVTEAVNDLLRPIRARRRELMRDTGFLDAVLLDGTAS